MLRLVLSWLNQDTPQAPCDEDPVIVDLPAPRPKCSHVAGGGPKLSASVRRHLDAMSRHRDWSDVKEAPTEKKADTMETHTVRAGKGTTTKKNKNKKKKQQKKKAAVSPSSSLWSERVVVPKGGWMVKNVKGSGSHKNPGGSWIGLIRKHHPAEALTRCAISGCTGPASHGGHVWVEEEKDPKFCFIVPLCSTLPNRHNHPTARGNPMNFEFCPTRGRVRAVKILAPPGAT